MTDAKVYLLLTLVSLSTGYWIGRGSQKALKRLHRERDATSNFGNQAETEEKTYLGLSEESKDCKLALVVRTDLGMSTGKIAAQCSHATLACYKTLLSSNPQWLRQWERTGQTKVTLRCNDEAELLSLQNQAQSLRLCAQSIQDAGRTQITAGSRTVLGIAGEDDGIFVRLFEIDTDSQDL